MESGGHRQCLMLGGRAAIEPASLRKHTVLATSLCSHAAPQTLPVPYSGLQLKQVVSVIKEALPRTWDGHNHLCILFRGHQRCHWIGPLSPGATDSLVLLPSGIPCIVHCTRNHKVPLALLFKVWPEGQPLKACGTQVICGGRMDFFAWGWKGYRREGIPGVS